MRIATWNINSVRLRLNLIEKLTQKRKPDVLCLQETKVVDDAFPHAALEKMGYAYRAISGMKSYNGVAILSRLPFKNTGIHHWYGQEDCRHVFAEIEGGPEIHCIYVPAGGDIPDPKENPKFAHKLGFLDEMTDWWSKQKDNKARVLLGDMNIAPYEQDVWSHKQLLDVVSHTPIEVEKLQKMLKASDWLDVARHFVPEEKKLYSWWSYRARDWEKSNRGRRLDHIWVNEPLQKSLEKYEILREARGWQPKPSDHVPVLVDLD